MPGKAAALQPISDLCPILQSHYVAGKVTTPEESNLLAKQVDCRTTANSRVKHNLPDSL